MRWAAVIVVCALGAIGLVQTFHMAVEASKKAAWVASASQCWGEVVALRGKLPQWEH